MQMTAPPADPLNAVLYALLEHKFGEVKIANAGISAHVQKLADPLRPGKFIERAQTWGEYYCVNCPFCKDARQRLWINHRYGAGFENNRRTDTHLANCYNDNCLAHPGRRSQLEDIVFGPGRPLRQKVAIKAATTSFVQEAVTAPGEICSIAGLPESHAAVRYVRERNFDPFALDQDFQVGVCTRTDEPRYKIMVNRLYIPITFNRQLIGWQGRATNDASVPKYFNCPGTSKSRMLYNFDNASQEPYAVVVEGVPSVWRIGKAGVCLFGKTMSLYQQITISSTWLGKPIVLMLDSDARVEMDQAVSLLRARNCDVRPIYLQDSRDPADYSADEIQGLISNALQG